VGDFQPYFLFPVFCFCNTQAGRRKAPVGNLPEAFIPETETHTHFAVYLRYKKAGYKGVLLPGKCQIRKIG
jgi:hypothetical protein